MELLVHRASYAIHQTQNTRQGAQQAVDLTLLNAFAMPDTTVTRMEEIARLAKRAHSIPRKLTLARAPRQQIHQHAHVTQDTMATV